MRSAPDAFSPTDRIETVIWDIAARNGSVPPDTLFDEIAPGANVSVQ